MAPAIPYTYIQCPCSELSPVEIPSDSETHENTENDDRTFDPCDPRSNYSLYPLEYLLYCEDCQQIRCPRCVNEEIVTYYCPHCLFEVPSSNLRSEGNRCTRSCFQCPVCVAPLQSVSLGAAQDASHITAEGSLNHTYALFCPYCNWSSSDVGIEFDRPSGIHSQLAKINNGGERKLTAKELKERRKENPEEPPIPDDQLDADLQFSTLKSFYQTQLADANASLGNMQFDSIGFSSPAALSRIMSLYTGHGHAGRKRQGPSDVMREALTTKEGLKVSDLDESAAIKKLQQTGWEETASTQQNLEQTEAVRFQDQLRPLSYLLRTKRSKRCSICRHIISKPENKVQSTRFKIRLVAKSYIPSIAIRPLIPTAPPVPTTYRPQVQEEALIEPHKTYHYILTFKNPLFENLKVTLATPYATPGRFSSKVTVLCPQFEVDANTDMWDDALKDDDRDRKRRGEESNGQVEAGKIWERGRNWVSIILEVVPSSLRVEDLPQDEKGKSPLDRGPLQEDEDVLEIPMFVRMEWEVDNQGDVGSALGKDKDGKEKRELAYWSVLGVGRIRKN